MSPFRALVWKEWRESWWLLALMVFAPAVCHVGTIVVLNSHRIAEEEIAGPVFVNTTGPAQAVDHGLSAMTVGLMGILALSLGAGLFSGERARGTAAFVAERPVARRMVWKAKLLLSLPAVLFGSLLLAGATQGASMDNLPPVMLPVVAGVPVVAIFIFGAAALASVLVDRPITAWAFGGVIFVGLAFGEALALETLGLVNLGPPPVALALTLASLMALAMLALTAFLFERNG